MSKQKYKKIECPECGSTSTVSNGYAVTGYQRLKCKECEHKWRGVFNPEKVTYFAKTRNDYKPRVSKKSTINKPKKPTIKAEPSNPFTQQDYNIDLIADVPCFLCPKQDTCKPQNCGTLANFLEGGENE